MHPLAQQAEKVQRLAATLDGWAASLAVDASQHSPGSPGSLNRNPRSEKTRLHESIRIDRMSHSETSQKDLALAATRAVSTLREISLAVDELGDTTQKLIRANNPRKLLTTRADTLATLNELIGDKPIRSWEEEWVPMVCDFHMMTNRPIKGSGLPQEMGMPALTAWVEQHFHLGAWRVDFMDRIEDVVSFGWPRESAMAFAAFLYTKAPLARALRDGDSCYAASTYALCNILFEQRHRAAKAAMMQTAAKERWQRRLAAKPTRLYTHLEGRDGLSLSEPGWLDLLTPDETGFRGHTCNALVTADCEPARMGPEGHKAFNVTTKALEAVDSDVVCIEPRPDDGLGAHAPVMFSEKFGAFPPNTLFRLQRVEGAGTWEGPGGCHPSQRLLVVTATFRKASRGREQGARLVSKLTGSPVTLSYGDREAFVHGLADLLASPTLTLEHEFTRDKTWLDWKGVAYSLRQEWAYVNGPAVPKADCTPGWRDRRNEGKTVEGFLAKANEFIRGRRQEAEPHAPRAQAAPAHRVRAVRR